MKRSIRESLEDSTAVMEYIVSKLPDLTLPEKVDVAARLKSISKHCEAIDKSVKEDIAAKLKGKDGTVLGELFKSVRKWIDKRVFDSKAFKEAEPALYEK